jgi:hypothetical protein
MYNSEFRQWLYGYYTLSGSKDLSSKQLWIIKNHLNLVCAVEGRLDITNQWLDDIIVAHVKGGVIKKIPEYLELEIYEQYSKEP